MGCRQRRWRGWGIWWGWSPAHTCYNSLKCRVLTWSNYWPTYFPPRATPFYPGQFPWYLCGTVGPSVCLSCSYTDHWSWPDPGHNHLNDHDVTINPETVHVPIHSLSESGYRHAGQMGSHRTPFHHTLWSHHSSTGMGMRTTWNIWLLLTVFCNKQSGHGLFPKRLFLAESQALKTCGREWFILYIYLV